MSESIELKTLKGEYYQIGQKCDVDNNGKLEGNEVSIFNTAKSDYDKNGSFFFKGKKYVYDKLGTIFKEEKLYDITNRSDQTAIYNKRVPNIVAANKNSSKSDPFAGYDEKKGRELAMVAYGDRNKKLVKNKKGKWTDFLGLCATYFKKALVKVGLLSEYKEGNGCDMDNVLDNESCWREIPVESVDLNHLPPGLALVYEKGQSGYSKDYGHVEISLGDTIPEVPYGAVSDGVTRNIRVPSKIYMPVKV